MLSRKLEDIRTLLASCQSCLVAYSGGVDSALLAYLANDVLGDRAIAVIADTPSLPRRELKEAIDLAERFHLTLEVVCPQEFENEEYLSNPVNRCFFCKHELFAIMEPLAEARGVNVLLYGENASDLGDHRPGAKAAAAFQVRAPFKEVGLTKAEIRELSAQFGLPTAEKPQMACLSSRIPYGQRVNPEKLRMIEEAENWLRDLGFRDVRVRHHEDDIARVEVAPDDVSRLQALEFEGVLRSRLQGIGYSKVEVDPQGYRRGSLNESLAKESG